MKILGIDTTTKFLCLGAYDGAKIYEYNLALGTKHSALLVPTIKRILDALQWHISEVDYFACGLGPGSFTGMRVGLATIKGFSWATKRLVIGISTLDILAQNVNPLRDRLPKATVSSNNGSISNGLKDSDKDIIPIIDAKRELIYCSIYKKKNRKLSRVKPYMLLSIEEFFKIAKPDSIIFGDAVSLFKEEIIRRVRGANILDKDYWYPKAHNIIALALERIKEKKFENSFGIRPIYLYPKECQIRISHMANCKS
jgi:tRNA threonylcarbamoyladenosine biosynthesis protein TsaB